MNTLLLCHPNAILMTICISQLRQKFLILNGVKAELISLNIEEAEISSKDLLRLTYLKTLGKILNCSKQNVNFVGLFV